jgi:LytS/YehU family sensor histidine kinase
VLLCFAIHLIIARLGHRSFGIRALALALIVPLAALACYWMSYLSKLPLAPEYASRELRPGEAVRSVISWFWYMLAWAALYLALRYSHEVKASERRARIVEAHAHAAQLRALQNQISPHFMFNTMNSISSLMLDGKVGQAERMLGELSGLLRSTLTLDALADIPLSEELRNQRMYLDIEKARFPDMDVAIECPEELSDALVPALITQPVVENAVKYGVARSPDATAVRITASRRDDQLVLVIEDDGHGATQAAPGLGLGLRNVADRLRTRFGQDHAFSAGPTEPKGFRVELTLPLSWTR